MSLVERYPLFRLHCVFKLFSVCSYQLAEGVDAQLRRMEQDLKVIIEQMNSSNAAEDEDNPVCDLLLSRYSPSSSLFVYVQMVKVVKILNAHADSLNWIDRNTGITTCTSHPTTEKDDNIVIDRSKPICAYPQADAHVCAHTSTHTHTYSAL